MHCLRSLAMRRQSLHSVLFAICDFMHRFECHVLLPHVCRRSTRTDCNSFAHPPCASASVGVVASDSYHCCNAAAAQCFPPAQ